MILTTINIVIAVIGLILAVIRLAECIYELRKTPDLNAVSKIWAVIKNFFTIEQYNQEGGSV